MNVDGKEPVEGEGVFEALTENDVTSDADDREVDELNVAHLDLLARIQSVRERSSAG